MVEADLDSSEFCQLGFHTLSHGAVRGSRNPQRAWIRSSPDQRLSLLQRRGGIRIHKPARLRQGFVDPLALELGLFGVAAIVHRPIPSAWSRRRNLDAHIKNSLYLPWQASAAR